MNHIMRLRAEPFHSIESGKKTFELRLYDEKRRMVHSGDTITFVNTEDLREIAVKVIKMHVFSNFDELYKNLPLIQCGYDENNIGSASPSDMDLYYSRDEQNKYGVVGVEISLIS